MTDKEKARRFDHIVQYATDYERGSKIIGAKFKKDEAPLKERLAILENILRMAGRE
jgi:hypothetical protein